MDNKIIIHISTLNASLINSTSHFSFTMDNTIKDVIDLKLKVLKCHLILMFLKIVFIKIQHLF